MEQSPVQILEVRAARSEHAVTVTAAVSADASREIFIALSEELDRRRAAPMQTVQDILATREHTALVERFESLAGAGAHSVVPFSDVELRLCLLELTQYADRVDGDHYQPVDLRTRLQVLGEITPVLWDANAAAAAASDAASVG